jgi:hypothetical protein
MGVGGDLLPFTSWNEPQRSSCACKRGISWNLLSFFRRDDNKGELPVLLGRRSPRHVEDQEQRGEEQKNRGSCSSEAKNG